MRTNGPLYIPFFQIIPSDAVIERLPDNAYSEDPTFNKGLISEKTSSIVQKLKSIYTKLTTRNTAIKQDEAEIIEETINEITENTTIIEETSKNAFVSNNTYYIIGGAFSDQKNATKMLNKLTRKNYNAEIITEGSLMRVSYSSFYNREDAILSLNQIKQENPEAWLLTK